LAATVIDIDGRPEAAIKVVRTIESNDGCTVGFVMRVQSKLPVVVMTELYSLSHFSYKQENSVKNC
jgi:hypothetical protein